MAKKSAIQKSLKILRLVELKKEKRSTLKKILKSTKSTNEDKKNARLQMAKIGNNSCSTRIRNRCFLTGNSRGYYRDFGLCRDKLREFAGKGQIPGLMKSSW